MQNMEAFFYHHQFPLVCINGILFALSIEAFHTICTNCVCLGECQILGHMTKDAQSLMLVTVIKNIKKLGYVLKVSCSHIYVFFLCYIFKEQILRVL